jgi:hypothetical protein
MNQKSHLVCDEELIRFSLCQRAIRFYQTLCGGLVFEETLDLPKWARISQIDA